MKKMKGVNAIMSKNISKIKEINVAAVVGNKILAADVNRHAVERCKDAIKKTGIIHTPVVSTVQGGNNLLLSGQCELTALKELGVKKMNAIEVELSDDTGAKEKLSLLLISLKDRPGALCEGLLIQEAVSAGVTRTEIKDMLGKSGSWISNRISLVTRLDKNVYKMVTSGLLDPRSAQEIARMPASVQFEFAEKAVKEGLPKSSIELLVASYNSEKCPDSVKTQIINDPKTAIKRMMDKRRAVKVNKGNYCEKSVPSCVIDESIDAVRIYISELHSILLNTLPLESVKRNNTLEELKSELLNLLVEVNKIVSPGKKEANNHV